MRNPVRVSVTACVVIAAFAAAAVAYAASPHWVVSPYCSQTSANTLSCSGKAAGLGSLPLFVVVSADAGCTNQDGSHIVPGHSTTVSGPFSTSNGQFTFGAEDKTGQNVVTASGPTSCPGSLEPFVSTTNVTLSIYECSSGSPTFNKKGEQTNSSCTLDLGPTPATIV